MLFIEAIESVKCLDEGVIESVADANIGSIMGIGFPGWTGGVLQYINGYEHPAMASARRRSSRAPASSRAVRRALRAARSLVEMAERGETLQRRADPGRHGVGEVRN